MLKAPRQHWDSKQLGPPSSSSFSSSFLQSCSCSSSHWPMGPFELKILTFVLHYLSIIEEAHFIFLRLLIAQFRALFILAHRFLWSRNYCWEQWALDLLQAIRQVYRPNVLPLNRHHFNNRALVEEVIKLQYQNSLIYFAPLVRATRTATCDLYFCPRICLKLLIQYCVYP